MKKRGDFRFKKFSVAHDASTHKVGTDGVLLGAWVSVNQARNILDIGTGSGVIALMLAQRSSDNCLIDAVEIQASDADEARKNVQKSPWPEKITVHHSSIQRYACDTRYDLIVSNPPFFISSWLPPDQSRSTARHTNELSFQDLLESVDRLLLPTGTFGVVLPFAEGMHFIEMTKDFRLHVSRKLIFRSRPEKPPERLLIEFRYRDFEERTEELVLYSNDEEWSADYRNLMKDFYLRA